MKMVDLKGDTRGLALSFSGTSRILKFHLIAKRPRFVRKS